MTALEPLRPSLYGVLAITLLLGANDLVRPEEPLPRAAEGASAPVVESVTPNEGGLVGGETMIITGSDLTAVTSVEVDGVPITPARVVNGAIELDVPNAVDYQPGPVEVVVFHGAAAIAEHEWTYLTSTPVDRQLEYAFRHWDDYNTFYFGDFNEWGGDCMNFVSQTLIARGWTPTADWFNTGQVEWADSFVHVPSFDEWLAGHPEYGAVRLDPDEFASAKAGDLVMFDWEGDGSLDHAQVVSRVAGDGSKTDDEWAGIQMVGHNVDSTYRGIDEALVQQGTSSARVHIWSIP